MIIKGVVTIEEKKLGIFLRILRKRQGYSQEELAQKLCLRRQSYSHYETGRNHPPLDILIRLADIYDISIDAFTKLTDDNATNEPVIIKENSGSYIFFNPSLKELQYNCLNTDEAELINYYRLLDERDQRDILEIAKLKTKRTSKF